MAKIKGTEIVEKRNILNEVRRTSMSLQELRLFSIYLAKINARDIKTRLVRFNLADFQKIMGFGKMNIAQIQESTNSLLTKVVNIPNENGGYTGFTLFKKCTLDKDKYGEWFIEIDANDIALPLMFNFKSHYFTYELWNALQLKSANQLRMYELLKQYEHLGKREIEVSKLRELLGVAPNEYPRWDNFKRKVLDSCQQALTENTDICFTYEKGKSGGRGGKWLTIVFHIKKNKNYVDRLSLKQFIDLQSEPSVIESTATVRAESIPNPKPQEQFFESEEQEHNYSNSYLSFLAEACNDEFTEDEMFILSVSIKKEYLPPNILGMKGAKYEYLAKKYAELNYQAKQKTINNRFKYFKKMLENDFE